MIQTIISPAKQMRVARDAFEPQGIPPLPLQTERLRRELLRIEREQGPEGLRTLWHVSDKLLAQGIERLHAQVPVLDEAQLEEADVARSVSAAAFSYVGIQYRSLAPEVLDLDALSWLQGHLWVISGLYGCVRPFDAVQPYRLEMGAKLAVDGARDLYGFWGDLVARAIEAAGAGEPLELVNLASVEYAKAVLPHVRSKTRIVTCLFGESVKDGKPVQRATASKIARGSMVRWMAERRIERAEDLVRFDVGYRYAPELSAPGELVFMRDGANGEALARP